MKQVSKFKLAGLNRGGWKAAGFSDTYATVDLPNEDWFHAKIDMNHERLEALWKWLADDKETYANKYCIVEYDDWSSGGVPINPVVKEIISD